MTNSGKESLTDIYNKIKAYDGSNGVIYKIDFSCCELTDQDMKYIYDISLCLPSLECIKLRNNQISLTSETVEIFKKIFDHNKNLHIDVIQNKFNQEFFKSVDFNIDFQTRLLWIPSAWIDGNGWKTLVTDENIRNIVICCHMKYY